jgi:acyl-CoA reductase-like NAD-dependent aldehyde dehydrogenase
VKVLPALRTETIVRAVSDAAARWTEGDFPPRVRLLDRVVERTGYSAPVAEYALDRLFGAITHEALTGVIAGELGGARTLPLGEVCVISSRTTIGVAIVPAVFALCAGCRVLVKDREDSLVSAFFETLAQERSELVQTARAQHWDSAAADAASLGAFDAVVAFGSDRTLEAIARSLPPRARFIGYGSAASAGYVTRESLASSAAIAGLAERAARDVVLYESEGCLSLHVLFAERGGEIAPQHFARVLAAAIEHAAVEFPPGRRDDARRARVAHARDLAVFRAASGKGTVFSDADASYAVFFDPPREEPPAFLPRAIALFPVDAPGEAAAYVRRHALRLEGFALSAARGDAIRAAMEAGAVRLTRFGELQHPPLAAHHGGRPRIAEFVRWIDDEL